MRAMPSPAEMIVPSSETSTPALNPSICCRRTLVISSAFSSAMPPSPQDDSRRAPGCGILRAWISVRPGQLVAQGFDVAFQAPVVALGPDPRARPSEEGRVDALRDLHGASRHVLQSLLEPLQLGGRQ